MTNRRILAIVPHPDDETYSFGGTLALAARARWHVSVIAATAGEHGERHDGEPAHPATLGIKRIAELAESCDVLGVTESACWGLPDGGLVPGDGGAVDRILDLVREIEPGFLLSLGADGAYGHPDHLAVYRWIEEARAAFETPVRVLYTAFPRGIFAPQHARCVEAGVLGHPPIVNADDLGAGPPHYSVDVRSVREVKLEAIRQHRTQLPDGDPFALFPGETVSLLLNAERFADGNGLPSTEVAEMLAELMPGVAAPGD